MLDYSLYFKPKDITAKFCEAHRFPPVKKNAFAHIEVHAMTSWTNTLAHSAKILLKGLDQYQRLEHTGQRTIVETLQGLPYQLGQKSSALMRELWKPGLDATSIDSLAEEYYAITSALLKPFPLAQALTALGALTPEQRVCAKGWTILYHLGHITRTAYSRQRSGGSSSTFTKT